MLHLRYHRSNKTFLTKRIVLLSDAFEAYVWLIHDNETQDPGLRAVLEEMERERDTSRQAITNGLKFAQKINGTTMDQCGHVAMPFFNSNMFKMAIQLSSLVTLEAWGSQLTVCWHPPGTRCFWWDHSGSSVLTRITNQNWGHVTCHPCK